MNPKTKIIFAVSFSRSKRTQYSFLFGSPILLIICVVLWLCDDQDNDGHLDFEEFYAMSLRHKWMVRNMLTRYCRFVVPPPKPLEGDEPDGAYEKQMSICPPPLTMVLFSIIEIIMFLVDVIHFQ